MNHEVVSANVSRITRSVHLRTSPPLDNDEYFWYAHTELPGHDSITREPQNAASDEDDMPDLGRPVRSVDGLLEASRDDLKEGGFSLYSICWPSCTWPQGS